MSGHAREGQAALDAAKQALARGPQGLDAALTALARAHELGNGEASAKLGHFMACGVRQKTDWDGSLDLLALAAERGWAQARAELKLLAGGGEGSPGEMRARVDIGSFIAPRRMESVSTSPRIRTAPGFMNAAECGWLIAASATRLSPATLYDNAQSGLRLDGARTNSAADFALPDMDLVLVLLQARIAHTIGLPKECFEPASVLHYTPGQEFRPHHDFLDPNVRGQAEEILLRGQRMATFLVYLNEGFDGGETDFPLAAYRFKGRTGDAIAFANVDPSFTPDAGTLHAGMSPTSGEKWLLSQWVRNKPVR